MCIVPATYNNDAIGAPIIIFRHFVYLLKLRDNDARNEMRCLVIFDLTVNNDLELLLVH